MSLWADLVADIQRGMSTLGWASVVPVERPSRGAVDAPSFWPAVAQAETADVELEATAHGGPVRVLCLGPGAEQGPCFVRVGWGELSVEPEIWAVLGGVAMEVMVGGAACIVPSFQVAGGAGQLQLGVGFWLSARDFSSATAVVHRALAAFDGLCASLRGTGQAGWAALVPGFDPFFARARGSGARRRRRSTFPVGVGLLVLTAVGSVASFLASPEIGAIVLTNVAPVTLFGGIAALASRPKDTAPDGSGAFDRAIRSCAVFDEHERVRALAPLKPAVVFGASRFGRRSLGTATFKAGIFGARSTAHGLSLTASLQSLTSSVDVHPLCRLVPGSWVVAELEGPDAILARLRPRRREQRQEGALRVVFDEASLERGEFDELLAELSEAVDAGQGGPYR
jgi:hypothetical protein